MMKLNLAGYTLPISYCLMYNDRQKQLHQNYKKIPQKKNSLMFNSKQNVCHKSDGHSPN